MGVQARVFNSHTATTKTSYPYRLQDHTPVGQPSVSSQGLLWHPGRCSLRWRLRHRWLPFTRVARQADENYIAWSRASGPRRWGRIRRQRRMRRAWRARRARRQDLGNQSIRQLDYHHHHPNVGRLISSWSRYALAQPCYRAPWCCLLPSFLICS